MLLQNRKKTKTDPIRKNPDSYRGTDQVGTKHPSVFSTHAKTIYIILFLTLIGGTILSFVGTRHKEVKITGVRPPVICSDDVLKKAVVAAESGQQKQQQQVVNDIRQKPNFDKDPNCLYTLLNYYIGISDAVDAKEYLNKFKSTYNEQIPLNKILVVGFSNSSIQTMEATVQFLEKADKANTKPEIEPGKHE